MERAIKKWWWLFLLPTLLAFIIGFVVPFIEGVYLSFCEFTTIDKATFVGLENFKKIWDDRFTSAFLRTGAFTIITTVLINVIAFAIAVAVTRKLAGRNVFRAVFFMPNLIGGIVLGYIWQSLIDGVLAIVGKPLLQLNPTWGFWGLVMLMCWQQIGYMMIIYIAGLQNVPSELLEAARIDGASNWKTLWKVKIPMVMPSITICLFLTLTNSFKLFDQNVALTGGAPGHQSELLALNIYSTFYDRAGAKFHGYAQAKAVVFFLLVVVIALVQLRATRSKEVQQ